MTFDKHGEFDDDHVWIEVGYIMYLVPYGILCCSHFTNDTSYK
jgi:hypothetical protein